MFFSILIIIFILVIGFFHYLQGFFSATISAILAVISAAVAVGFHESLVGLLGPTKFADQANALLLVSLFAVNYVVLRTIFDKLVPGNVRVQSTIDKVGGAVMGLVAGIFATGIVAIAAQALPFGPSLGGYSRLPLKDVKEVQVKPSNDATALDRKIIDEVDIKGDDFAKEPPAKMLVPADDMVVATVGMLSQGSLAGKQPLYQVHPDWLNELFGQRLGIELGTRHTAYNYDGKEPLAEVTGVYRVDFLLDAKDAEVPENRTSKVTIKKPTGKGQELFFVVRCRFSDQARDPKDDMARVSPGAVRLAAGPPETRRNYFPIGTLDPSGILYVNKIDDPLIVDLKEGGKSIDFAFVADRKDILAKPQEKDVPGKTLDIAPDVLFEVKRLALTDLSDKPGKMEGKLPGADKSKDVEVLRKLRVTGPAVAKVVTPTTPTTPAAPITPAVEKVAAPLVKKSEKFDSKLFTKVDAGTDQDGPVLSALGVTGELKGGKYVVLDVGPDETIDKLKFGKDKFDELVVPAGKNLYQINFTPSGDSWQWAEKINAFEVVDTKGALAKPVGYWAVLKPASGPAEHMVAHYDPNAAIGGVAKSEGTPTSVWLAYLLPAGAAPKELRYDGKLADTLAATPPR